MTKRRSIAIGGGIGLLLVAALWLAVSPYLTLHRIQKAVQMQDAQTVSDYVDYDSLRASIKSETGHAIDRAVARRGGGPAQSAIAKAGVGRMVDTFVQPPLITMMLADDRSPSNPVGGKLVGDKVVVRRTGIASFEVSGSRPGSIVFGLRGLGWKIVGVRMPDA